MKSSRLYCLISACSCFEMKLKFPGAGVAIVWQGAALPMSFNISSKNYHQEHATEVRRLPKDVMAAWGAVFLRFHGVSNLYT